MTRSTGRVGIETKFVDDAIGKVAADGSFSGYASLFGRLDLAKDIVAPGAFSGSIRDRGVAGVRMLYQHDPALPIGVWTELREDGRGLFVRGRLTMAAAKAREVFALMREGALDGLSIGFRATRTRRDPVTGHRHILEVDLQEISVVTFPMLPGARVARLERRGDASGAALMALNDRIRATTRLIRSPKRIRRS
jgi:HK97 family phage prohead protease